MRELQLLTAYNEASGAGHFWRMVSLLLFLTKQGLRAKLSSDNYPDSYLPHFREHLGSVSNPKDALCIRDMRDSKASKIKSLKQKFYAVATVDDSGEGDRLSDTSIKLLPLDTKKRKVETPFPFLYGYNFYKELSELTFHPQKEYDALIYTGYTDDLYPVALEKLFPHNSRLLLIGKSGQYIWENGNIKATHINYVEALLSSRLCLSHFGVSLYEAAVSGLPTVAINPSKYHAKLAENETNIVIHNLGTFDNLEYTVASEVISSLLNRSFAQLTTTTILQSVEAQHALVLDRLMPFLEQKK